MRNGLLCHQENLSLAWNTDGGPIFKSSKSSMWPVMCMINELPMKMRRENIMLTALWFGEYKPDMSVFLKPFVDECNVLSSTGLQWMHIGVEKNIKSVPTGVQCRFGGQTDCTKFGPVQWILWM